MSAANDTSTTGAFRQSWRHPNPRDVLARIVAAHPRWGMVRIKKECWSQIMEEDWEYTGSDEINKSLAYTCFSYWFDNNYRSLVGAPRRRPPENSTAEPVRSRQTALAAQFAARIEEHVEARVEEILLNTVMPNGKPLRDNTREELDESIAWQQRIRDRLLPGQTPGEAGLTEEEVRDLL